jgi:hypothetical protein
VPKVPSPTRTAVARTGSPRAIGRKVATRFDNTDQILGLLDAADTITTKGKIILDRKHLPNTLTVGRSKDPAPIRPNGSPVAPPTHRHDRQLSAGTAIIN